MKITKFIKEAISLPIQIGVTEEAEQARNELILQSGQMTQAINVVEANSVGEAARDIRTFTKNVRDMGLTIRRPITAILTKLKAVEDDYCMPLEQEQARLERLATDFAQAERRRVAEEERVRQAEIQRLERERLAAERKAQEERERVARENREAEERARAAEAAIVNQAELDAAIASEAARKAEAAQRQAEADAQAEAARKASEASQAAMRAPLPAAHKIGGVTTKRVMDYEVVDLKKVYAARPELCSLEIKPSAVRAVCVPKFLPASDEVDSETVPGLKLFWRDQSSTRKW